MIEGTYNRGGVNPPPTSKRPEIKLSGMEIKNKVGKDIITGYLNKVTTFISPRKSEKELELTYEYFNILFPLGWIIYLEGANPPEILLAGAGALNIDKGFNIMEAKPRLKVLEEEMRNLQDKEIK